MKFLQVDEEFAWFVEIVRREGARSFLEIGSKYGESLRRVAEAMPVPSRIVAVDLPNGTKEWRQSQAALQSTADELRARGHEVHIVWGDSTDATVIDQVRSLGPFDAAFIDANHTLPYVTKDWETYGPMARVIGFHDIAWRRAPEWVGTRIDVPKFWELIKGQYRHDEIKVCPTGKNNGIGVIWR